MTTAPPTPAPDAPDGGWTPRLGFSLLSMVLILELLSASYLMISMALPTISQHYETDQTAWMMTGFLLVGAVSAPLLGKAADMVGKRKVLLACVAVATVGFLVSAVAPTYGIMIVGRALGGFLIPPLFLTYSLIRDVFPQRTVALAVSISTAGMGLVAIPTPFLAGWLIDDFGWRSMFWFCTIILAVMGVLVRISTPETPVRIRSHIDITGAVLIGGGLAGILLGVSFGPTWGWSAPGTLVALVGGVVLLAAWLVSASKIPEPLVRLSLLRRRSVLLIVVSAGCIYGVSTLFSTILPYVVMMSDKLGLGYGFGVDHEGFAVFQVPTGGMTMVGGLIVGFLVGRGTRPRLTMAAGMLVAGVGAALSGINLASEPYLLVCAGLVGLGMGLAYASIPNLLIEAVAPQLQASTASIVAAVQSVFPGILSVIMFTVLNGSFKADLPAEITQGAAFYTSQGWTVAFLMTAAVALAGLVAAVLLPKRFAQATAEGPAEAGAPAPAEEAVAAGA
ncbi:MFS transporter [Tomitella gaofuii]|uniref:MFS transporter n=1 Tax=Tomitella gaofuii TaxID=2760083 RepID=UPI0015F7DBEF|nr:MFS transporter [Tomitella gaofuii]